MSRDNLENLLDSMLEESATRMEADETRAREGAAEAERSKQAQALRARAADSGQATFHEVVTLTGLPDEHLREVLSKAAPDDLLIILATAADPLQRRILGNLSADSVKWLRDNLAYIESVSNAEREAAEKKVLKVANALLESGDIGLPEPESVGKDAAPDASDKDLRNLLTNLVRIAGQAGPEALSEVLESAGEPLLRDGLALIVEGKKGDALEEALRARRSELEADHARRLGWMHDALIAIAEGGSAEDFRAKLFET